jgi:hypothetical protein
MSSEILQKTENLAYFFQRYPSLRQYLQPQDLFESVSQAPRFKREFSEPNPKCPLCVPKNLCLETFSEKKKRQHRHETTPAEIEFKRQLEKGKPSEYTALKIGEERLAARSTLMYADGVRETHIFKGMVRGDRAYCRKIKERIDIALDMLDGLDGTLLFFTGTIAWTHLSNKLVGAYRIAKKQLDKWLKNMRRYGNFKYVAVLESQESGNPHWHVLCKFIGQNYDLRRDSKGRYYVLNPGVGKQIRKWWGAGICKLLALPATKGRDYVKKYLVKSIQDIMDKGAPKTADEQETYRKELFGLIGPIVMKMRTLRKSNGLTPVKAADPEPGRAADSVASSVVKREEKNCLPEEKLEALLNKLTNACAAKVWLLPRNSKETRFLEYENVYQPPGLESEIEFKKNAVPLGCLGCIFTEILRLGESAAAAEFADFIRGIQRVNVESSYSEDTIINFLRDECADL